jgi:hypothetical protein
MSRESLGHIDCPHCGHKAGMRITLDKSGAPFGFCEANCNGQMRVGGNAARVAAFYRNNPHLKQPGAAPEIAPAVTSTATESKNKPRAAMPAPAPAIEPAPDKAPRKPSLFEQLAGVTHG